MYTDQLQDQETTHYNRWISFLQKDNAQNLGEMQGIIQEDNIYTLSPLTLQIQQKEDSRKSETEEITSTNPCSQVTKSKLKAFLQNKGSQGIVLRTMPGQYASRTEPDVITISQDDGNASLIKVYIFIHLLQKMIIGERVLNNYKHKI